MLQIKTTDTEWQEVPDPPKPNLMKIKIAPFKEGVVRTLHNKPVKADSVHETDENTARNLIKKGFAVAADDEAKSVDLQESSRLSEEQAETQVEAQVRAREEKKAKDDAAKDRKKKGTRR